MSSSYSSRRDWLFGTAILAPGLASPGSSKEKELKGTFRKNVLDYGAVGESKTINTRSIQAAIDHCSQAGGGTDFFPCRYLSFRNTIFEEQDNALVGAGCHPAGSKRLPRSPVSGGKDFPEAEILHDWSLCIKSVYARKHQISPSLPNPFTLRICGVSGLGAAAPPEAPKSVHRRISKDERHALENRLFVN